MALVEGGSFKCYLHDFESKTVKGWNEHCLSKPHFESGSTGCANCSETIEFSNLPFHPLDAGGSKNIRLVCDDCNKKQNGDVVMTKKVVKTVSAQDKGGK